MGNISLAWKSIGRKDHYKHNLVEKEINSFFQQFREQGYNGLTNYFLSDGK